MCGVVVVNNGEKEIETPREFREYFGFDAPRNKHYNNVDPDCCLCQVDVEKALTEQNMPFMRDCGDIYVENLKDGIK